jgi:hypothetical protein
MIQFIRRTFHSLFGEGYGSRLRRIAKILNVELSNDLTSDEEIEAEFVEKMAERKYAGSLDWRFRRDEIVDLLTAISSDEEEAQLCSVESAGRHQGTKLLEEVNRQLRCTPGSRQAIVLESLGDFCHVLLVPSEAIDKIREIAGGWLKEGSPSDLLVGSGAANQPQMNADGRR